MAEPVCTTCNDSHRMDLHDESEDVREVMCTRCPTPCRRCGKGGPYCVTTPCGCSCHGDRFNDRLLHQPNLETSVRVVERALDRMKVRSVTFTDAAAASVRVELKDGTAEWHGCLWHAVEQMGGGRQLVACTDTEKLTTLCNRLELLAVTFDKDTRIGHTTNPGKELRDLVREVIYG